MNHSFFSTCFFCCFLFLLFVHGAKGTELKAQSKQPERFQLHYGGDETLLKSIATTIGDSDLIVIDLRGITAYQFGVLKRKTVEKNATLICYISIGELHSRELGIFEEFAKSENPNVDFAKLKSEVLIGKNHDFDSWYADASHPVWRKFIFDKASNMFAAGVDGLFLDTVDTVDIYIKKPEWNVDRRAKSVTGMISLTRELKKQHPAGYIMQNRGLNLIGSEVFVGDEKGKLIPGLSLATPNPHNPDAILFENAFSANDQWGKQIVSQLEQIQQSGESTVVALGYKDTVKDRDRFYKRCKQSSFVPAWSSNSHSLHQEVAR